MHSTLILYFYTSIFQLAMSGIVIGTSSTTLSSVSIQFSLKTIACAKYLYDLNIKRFPC